MDEFIISLRVTAMCVFAYAAGSYSGNADTALSVFAYAAGFYFGNVCLAIEGGSNVDLEYLQEQPTARKGFALDSVFPGSVCEASDVLKSAPSGADVTFQHFGSCEFSLTGVSYCFDCDPMVVKCFYEISLESEAYIAGTTSATARARGPGPPFRLNYRVVLRNPCFACLRFGAVTSTCVGFASVRVIPWVWGTYPVHGGANELYFVVSDIRKQFLVGNLGAFCDIASSPLSSMASQACVRSARLCATSWAGAHHRHRVRLSC